MADRRAAVRYSGADFCSWRTMAHDLGFFCKVHLNDDLWADEEGAGVTGRFQWRRRHSRFTSSCSGTELFTDGSRVVLSSVALASSRIRRRGQKE